MRTGYLRNLSREVRTELKLDDVVLVPGRSFEGMAKNETSDEGVTEIATAAADYLDQLITDTDVLAVSGGPPFMRNMVRYLNPSKLLPHLQVVATIGFVQAHTSDGDANLIAHDIAQAYGGEHTWCCMPAFFATFSGAQDYFPKMMHHDPIVKQAVDLHGRANVVMMGIWPPHTNNEVILRGILSKEQIQAVEALHPAVDINHWVFDADGRCINTMLDPQPYCLSGMEIPNLKEKIRQGTKVILVAGGGPAYLPALRAALKAGLASIVITDHITAQLLLKEQ